jgi:hypothetical protein
MKLYKREDFIKLPPMTIFSLLSVEFGNTELHCELYSKTSAFGDYKNDFVVQDLISECGFPDEITDGFSALEYQTDLRDNFKDYKTDLECAGRDGMYEDDDVFVVWDKEDVTKLRDYLNKSLEYYK